MIFVSLNKKLNKKVLLLILDGWGIADNKDASAPDKANTPNFNSLIENYPNNFLITHGEKVGLPKGQMGNSEVGHMNIGSGRIVLQDLLKINNSIKEGEFRNKSHFNDIINYTKKNSSNVHLMGLVSDGGVHSHIDHIKESISALTNEGDLEIFFHAFMDGRDTAQKVGHKYVDEMEKVPNCTFASMQGRSIGMDRDRRWEKIELAYNTFTGAGAISLESPKDYLNSEYDKGIYDEFITPALFGKESAMKEGDSIFFINFRIS